MRKLRLKSSEMSEVKFDLGLSDDKVILLRPRFSLMLVFRIPSVFSFVKQWD